MGPWQKESWKRYIQLYCTFSRVLRLTMAKDTKEGVVESCFRKARSPIVTITPRVSSEVTITTENICGDQDRVTPVSRVVLEGVALNWAELTSAQQLNLRAQATPFPLFPHSDSISGTGPVSITCCIQALCSRASHPPFSRTYRVSPRNSPLTPSSSRSPPTPRPHRSPLSSPHSPLSPPPAASDASLRQHTPAPWRPSRARWRSSAGSIPCPSAVIYPDGPRRRLGDGMRCGERARRGFRLARSN